MNLTTKFIIFTIVFTSTSVIRSEAAPAVKFISNKSILKRGGDVQSMMKKDDDQSLPQMEEIFQLIKQKGLVIGIFDPANIRLNLVDVIKQLQSQEIFVAIVNRQNSNLDVACNSSSGVSKSENLFAGASMSMIFPDDINGTLQITCSALYGNKMLAFTARGPGMPNWKTIVYNLHYDGIYYTDNPDGEKGLKRRWTIK